MIRAVWFLLWATPATLVGFAFMVGGAAVRHRGHTYDRVARAWSRIVVWASGSRLRVHGSERVDWSHPKVVVCNHTGLFESPALALAIPVPFHFIIKKELEGFPVFGWACRLGGHIAIDRGDREQAIASLRRASDIIHRDGGVIVIFPEGTRSRTGSLQPFKKGAFRLALEARVPILPVVVAGSAAITPSGKLAVIPGTLDLYFGNEVPIEGWTEENVDALIADVHDRMRAILSAHLKQTSPPA